MPKMPSFTIEPRYNVTRYAHCSIMTYHTSLNHGCSMHAVVSIARDFRKCGGQYIHFQLVGQIQIVGQISV